MLRGPSWTCGARVWAASTLGHGHRLLLDSAGKSWPWYVVSFPCRFQDDLVKTHAATVCLFDDKARKTVASAYIHAGRILFFFVCILMYFWWIFNIYCSLPHSFKGHSLKWIEIIFMFAILRKHNPYNKRSGSWLGFCERFNKKAKRLTRIWPPFPLGTEMTLSVTPKEYPNRTKAYLVLPSAISSTGEYCILWIRVHCC